MPLRDCHAELSVGFRVSRAGVLPRGDSEELEPHVGWLRTRADAALVITGGCQGAADGPQPVINPTAGTMMVVLSAICQWKTSRVCCSSKRPHFYVTPG